MERIQLTARMNLQGGEIPLGVIASIVKTRKISRRECVCCEEINEAMMKVSGEILLIRRVTNFMKRFIHCFDLVLFSRL